MSHLHTNLDKIPIINSDIKINFLSIYFTNKSLENLYTSCVFHENNKILKIIFLFMIIIYLITTTIGIIIGNPKLYIVFTINSILNVFLLLTFVRVKKNLNFKIILLIKYFSLIFTFSLLHIISIFQDFPDLRIRMIYILIFIRNFLYIIFFKTDFIIFLFSTLISIMTIFFYIFPYEYNKKDFISEIIIDLIFSCFTFNIKKYYEIISRKKFLELNELKKLNENCSETNHKKYDLH